MDEKPIYKLVPCFPGILKPVYSEEEYQSEQKSEFRRVIVVMVIAGTSLIGGLVFCILAVFEALKIL